MRPITIPPAPLHKIFKFRRFQCKPKHLISNILLSLNRNTDLKGKDMAPWMKMALWMLVVQTPPFFGAAEILIPVEVCHSKKQNKWEIHLLLVAKPKERDCEGEEGWEKPSPVQSLGRSLIGKTHVDLVDLEIDSFKMIGVMHGAPSRTRTGTCISVGSTAGGWGWGRRLSGPQRGLWTTRQQ